MTYKSELGKKGEDLACEYLVEKGFKILERNFRRPWGELDIVAKAPDKTLVFIEVKTISNNFGQDFGGLSPENQMTQSKLRKFKRTASLYANSNEGLVRDKRGWRLDLIAITVDSQNHHIKHYENI